MAITHVALDDSKLLGGPASPRGADEGRQHPCPARPRRGRLALSPWPALSARLARQTADQPPAVVTEAWRAQHRLHRRYRHLVSHGKRPTVAVTALARELVGFVWAALTRRPAHVAA
jgi:hypothetical protein